MLKRVAISHRLMLEFSVWQTASPVLRRWMRERISPRSVLRELRRGEAGQVERPCEIGGHRSDVGRVALGPAFERCYQARVQAAPGLICRPGLAM